VYEELANSHKKNNNVLLNLTAKGGRERDFRVRAW